MKPSTLLHAGSDPHAPHPTSIGAIVGTAWTHRLLVAQLVKREVAARYRGSVMGIAWPFLTPVLMLLVYTFVFSVVFKARWGIGEEESRAQFALVLFVGLLVHGLFAEVLNRAPHLIVSNVNFVKKVVFPLEILPLVTMGAAIVHCAIGIAVFLVAFMLSTGNLHWTSVFIPVVFFPLVVLTAGLAWFLASLGVFLRDVGQATGLLTTVMLFLAPVFYPVSALPEAFRPWLFLNPITFIIEQARAILVQGAVPDWQGLTIYFVVAVLICWLGYAWFQKTRKGFADVL